MKRLFLAICVSLMVVSICFAADVPDTAENRKIAAKRYLAVAPMADMLEDIIEKVTRNYPADQGNAYADYLRKMVKIDVLEKASLASMVKHFTVGELNALADFYGSPEGRSVMGKMGAYMAEILPVIQGEIMRAMKAYGTTK